jgi:AcrR family transcriptional regulator
VTAHQGRPTRTDARRNRASILRVAQRSFAEVGVGASLDVIAKRAGVGPGTLYRHFATRDSLVAAVLTDCCPDLLAEGAAIEAGHSDSRTALDSWLTAVSAWMRTFQGLPGPLREALLDSGSALAPRCQEVIGATDRFLAAAIRDGHARPGVRGVDLYLGTLAVAWAAGADSADDSVESALREMLHRGWATSTGDA